MENYMVKKADLVTDSAREAWSNIRQNAAEAGSVTEAKLKEAHAAFQEWLESIGESESSEIMQTLGKRRFIPYRLKPPSLGRDRISLRSGGIQPFEHLISVSLEEFEKNEQQQ